MKIEREEEGREGGERASKDVGKKMEAGWMGGRKEGLNFRPILQNVSSIDEADIGVLHLSLSLSLILVQYEQHTWLLPSLFFARVCGVWRGEGSHMMEGRWREGGGGESENERGEKVASAGKKNPERISWSGVVLT